MSMSFNEIETTITELRKLVYSAQADYRDALASGVVDIAFHETEKRLEDLKARIMLEYSRVYFEYSDACYEERRALDKFHDEVRQALLHPEDYDLNAFCISSYTYWYETAEEHFVSEDFDGARWRRVSLFECLEDLIRLHRECEPARYVCPKCGRPHNDRVQVMTKAAVTLDDRSEFEYWCHECAEQQAYACCEGEHISYDAAWDYGQRTEAQGERRCIWDCDFCKRPLEEQVRMTPPCLFTEDQLGW